MRDIEDLLTFIVENNGDDLVLCTIVRKLGSGYRSIGAKKVVARNTLRTSGVLSGGCLESDIEKTARERFLELPFLAEFSTMSDEDRLFGYQTGCQGSIGVLFERIPPNAMPSDLELMVPYGESPFAKNVSLSLEPTRLGERVWTDATRTVTQAVIESWVHVFTLNVIGCGAEGESFYSLAQSLGWRIRFFDYRAQRVDRLKHLGYDALLARANEIPSLLKKTANSGVVLCTHNYEADLEILPGLASLSFVYVGCVGPQIRLERLAQDCDQHFGKKLDPEWLASVSAPAGIYSRCRSPAEIALSIVAEIQGRLREHTLAQPWTILLAAGAASRFGSPKALSLLGERTLLAIALQTAHTLSGDRVLVVTGAHRDAIAEHLDGTLEAFNARWSDGMGSSIACGLRAARNHDSEIDIAVILCVDQPLVRVSHLRQLVRAARQQERCAMTSSADSCGPPVALPHRFFAQAENLAGERGLKSVLRPSEMIAIEDALSFQDVDRPEDLEQLAFEDAVVP